MSSSQSFYKVNFLLATESVLDNGKKIHGLLALPRTSINGRIYLPEELAKGHGKILPVYAGHGWRFGKTEKEKTSVGEMILTWDSQKQQLFFDALITNPEYAQYVEKNIKTLGASLGVLFDRDSPRVCGKERCYYVPRITEWLEGSIVENPSMPETAGTIVAVESIAEGEEQPEHFCQACQSNKKEKPTVVEDKDKKKRYKASFSSQIATFEEKKDGNLNVTGVLAVPRVNLNGSLLLPEALKKGHGLTIPMSIDHAYSFDNSIPPVGSMSMRYNDDKMQLEYDGVVTDNQAIADVKSGKYKNTSISIEFDHDDVDYIYGIYMIKDIDKFVEGSLVEHPAIPEATVVALESINKKLSGLSNVDDIVFAVLSERLASPDEKCMKQCLEEKKAKGIPIDKQAIAICINECGGGGNSSKKDDKDEDDNLTNSQYEKPSNNPQEMSASTSEAQKKDATNTNSNSNSNSTVAQTSSQSQVVMGINDVRELIEQSNASFKLALESISKENREFAEKIVAAQKQMVAGTYQPTANLSGKSPANPETVKKRLAEIKLQALAEDFRLNNGEISGNRVANRMHEIIATEAIDLTAIGTAAGGYWTADITTIPAALVANLRDTCDVKVIEKGAKDIHFTLMAVPKFAAVTPPTVPSDYSTTLYKVDDVIATPTTYGVKQTVTDQAIASATPDFMSELQNIIVQGALIHQDNLVLTTLDGIASGSLAGTYYGDGSVTAESSVTSAMTMAAKAIVTAKSYLEIAHYAVAPGQAICAMAPKQMADLFNDGTIKNALSYGTIPLSNVIVVTLYGIELRISDQVPTGKGSPTTTTTYHAFLYLKRVAIGLGFTQDVTIETGRVVGEAGTRVFGTYRGAAIAKTPTGTGALVAVSKIITA